MSSHTVYYMTTGRNISTPWKTKTLILSIKHDGYFEVG